MMFSNHNRAIALSRKAAWFFLFLVAVGFHAPVASAFDNPSVWTLIQEGRCPACDLTGAPLRARDFVGAKVQGADISGADLRFADFSGADLRGVSFSGSDLTGANLSGARIDAANFGGAVFCQTRMPDGSERSDECLEGTWSESNGAVVLIRQQGPGTFEAILASGGVAEHVGSVFMRNLSRDAPGLYSGQQYMAIEDEIMWLGTNCIVAGPQMQCLDGMLDFQRVTTVAVRPEPARIVRTFEYQPKADIGAPTNREGVGSR